MSIVIMNQHTVFKTKKIKYLCIHDFLFHPPSLYLSFAFQSQMHTTLKIPSSHIALLTSHQLDVVNRIISLASAFSLDKFKRRSSRDWSFQQKWKVIIITVRLKHAWRVQIVLNRMKCSKRKELCKRRHQQARKQLVNGALHSVRDKLKGVDPFQY